MSLIKCEQPSGLLSERYIDAEQELVEYSEAVEVLLNSESIIISFDSMSVRDDRYMRSERKLRPGTFELVSLLHRLGKNVYIYSDSELSLAESTLSDFFPSRYRKGYTLLSAEQAESNKLSILTQLNKVLGKFKLDSAGFVFIGDSRDETTCIWEVGQETISTDGARLKTAGGVCVKDVLSLSRVIKKFVEGASFIRDRSKYTSLPANDGIELSTYMDAVEMQNMVVEGLKRLWCNKLRSTVGLHSSSLWASEYLSLRKIKDFYDKFGEISGEIKVSQLGPNRIISNYFTEDRIFHQNNSIGLRGPKYFTCVDDRLSSSERISIMIDELYSAVSILESVDRASLYLSDLLPYLGVLDNAKQQALTLLHAFIFNERRFGVSKDPQYLIARIKLLDVATNLTRSFYEASFGRTYTTPVFVSDITEAEHHISKSLDRIGYMGLKLQELDHPLKIMLAAYNLSKSDPTDTVIGFPSGSTQLSIATALSNEILYKKAPRSVNIVSIPLSQHSGSSKQGARPISDNNLRASAKLFENYLKGRHIVIVDDNASTGSTISRAVDMLNRFNPLSVTTGVAEIDPQRILIRAKSAKRQQRKLLSTNLRHATFDCAVGVNPVSSRDVQLRKIYANKVLGNSTTISPLAQNRA